MKRLATLCVAVLTVNLGTPLRFATAGPSAEMSVEQSPTQRPTPPSSSATQAELKDLAAQVASLKDQLSKLQTENLRLSFRISDLESKNRRVSLDPASPKKYQRLDTTAGFFLVSFENAETYLDGYRVFIEIGNLSSARYVGFTLDTTWGPRYDWDKYTEDSFKKWQGQTQTKKLTFTEPLASGQWNRVALILPSTSASQLGFVEISLDTDTVSFGGR